MVDSLKLTMADKFMQSPEISSYQWLLHRWPKEEGTYSYEDHVIRFPSLVYQNVLQRVPELRNNFDWQECNKVHLGNMYEADFFTNICHDNYCICARARNGDEVSHVVRYSKKFTNSNNFKDIQTETLYIPDEKNKVGIDAVYIDEEKQGWLIQLTINPNHKALEVFGVLNQFNSIQQWSLCMIHPTMAIFHIPPVMYNGTRISNIDEYEHIVKYFPLLF